jgi:hypothetical protein
MIKRNIKPVFVAVSEIVNDMTRNVREATADAYDVEPLINDIAMRGQQDAATLEKIGDKYFPIKGFRRSLAIEKANERGMVYGDEAPEAGKPIDKVLAFVYEDLTERERVELLLDHGQRKGLTKPELYNAFKRAFVAGYKEKDVVTLLWSLIISLYPPDKDIYKDLPDKTADPVAYEKALAQRKLENSKGILQTAKRAYELPVVVEDEYYKRLRGEQAWPTNGELKDLHQIHSKEMTANPLLSRNKPGPKFEEQWEKVKTARQSGERNKPRVQTTMRNRNQVEGDLKILESIPAKVMTHIQLGNIPVDRLPVLDRYLLVAWNHLTEEQKAEVIAWLPKPKAEEAAK